MVELHNKYKDQKLYSSNGYISSLNFSVPLPPPDNICADVNINEVVVMNDVVDKICCKILLMWCINLIGNLDTINKNKNKKIM